jgi:hypothetical protein
VSLALRGFWWRARPVTRRALDHRVDPEFLIANCVASHFTCKRSGPLAARLSLRQRHKSASPALDERDRGTVFTREQVREGCARVSDARDEPGSGRYYCVISLRVSPDRDKRGPLELGCWYNEMMRCTRRRPCGVSGKDRQELVARIEAFYRNRWPGSAINRHSEGHMVVNGEHCQGRVWHPICGIDRRRRVRVALLCLAVHKLDRNRRGEPPSASDLTFLMSVPSRLEPCVAALMAGD